jgi:hypothetical protein
VAAVTAVNLKISGGSKLKRYLEALEEATGAATGVRVGFLENATYPATAKREGLHVAQVAFWNEFGTKFAPARPFFRGMIRAEQDHWGDDLGKHLKDNDFNSEQALRLMGVEIKDALTNKIATWPADNAPSTVARKGFDHGLVHTGVMQRATDFEVIK